MLPTKGWLQYFKFNIRGDEKKRKHRDRGGEGLDVLNLPAS
jgi:hypothetical protein